MAAKIPTKELKTTVPKTTGSEQSELLVVKTTGSDQSELDAVKTTGSGGGFLKFSSSIDYGIAEAINTGKLNLLVSVDYCNNGCLKVNVFSGPKKRTAGAYYKQPKKKPAL